MERFREVKLPSIEMIDNRTIAQQAGRKNNDLAAIAGRDQANGF